MTRTIIISGICLVLLLTGYELRITPADIEACQRATGWTAARCGVELSR